MKADKKKAKAEADETKPKSKTGDKTKGKRKADDAPSTKKKAKKSTPDSEVKLLPSPESKSTARVAASGKVSADSQGIARTKPTAKPTISSAKTAGTQERVSRSSTKVASEGAFKATKAGTPQSTQDKAVAGQGMVKTKSAASTSQRGSVASKATAKPRLQAESRITEDGDDITDEVAGTAATKVQDKPRLKVKPTSAAKARQEYAESEEDTKDKANSGDESKAEGKTNSLVQVKHTDEQDVPSKDGHKIKKSTFIIGAACVAVLFVGFCMLNFAPKKSGFPGGPGGPGFGGEATQVTVRSTTAQVGTLHDYVETNGEIECESSVDCYPDIGGKVARVYVSLGDRVWKGRALAEVDPNEPGTYYVNSVVYAPIGGMITSTPKEVGTTVTTTSSITTIGDVSRLQIRAKVPERYVSFLKIGLKANIILEAYPDETFTAAITKVSPVVDPDSRTKEILLRFDQSDPRINAGMFAKITLFTADYEGEIVVPSNTIVEKTGGKQNVFVLAPGGGSVSLREVETGKSVDTMIQILSGLNEGERVITEGMTSLSDGAPVRDITAGLGQSTSFAQAPSGGAADTPPSGAPGAGGPPPGGAPSDRGATR